MQTKHLLIWTIILIGLTACQRLPIGESLESEPVMTEIAPTQALQPTQTSSPTIPPTPTELPTNAPSTPVPAISTQTSLPAKICSPLADHRLEQLDEIVSQAYDPPPPGKDDRHHGLDFAYYRHGGRASIEGEVIQSVLPGRVAANIDDRLPYGNMVMIESVQENLHPELIAALDLPADSSLYLLYAHLESAPTFDIGQEITCGQALGAVGKTGYFVPVPHLHIEARVGPAGARFESMAFYDTSASEAERETYLLWRTSGEFQHFDPMLLFQIALDLVSGQ
jgi:murein DD-endopeptidase MepM/ murein hydrolase activator NlpD